MAEVGRVVAGWDEGQGCAVSTCDGALSNEVGVFMFRSLDTGKFALVCRPCAVELELDEATPWALVQL